MSILRIIAYSLFFTSTLFSMEDPPRKPVAIEENVYTRLWAACAIDEIGERILNQENSPLQTPEDFIRLLSVNKNAKQFITSFFAIRQSNSLSQQMESLEPLVMDSYGCSYKAIIESATSNPKTSLNRFLLMIKGEKNVLQYKIIILLAPYILKKIKKVATRQYEGNLPVNFDYFAFMKRILTGEFFSLNYGYFAWLLGVSDCVNLYEIEDKFKKLSLKPTKS